MKAIYVVAFLLVAGLSLRAESGGVLNGKVISIEGKEVDLGSYSGKVVLVVNVASRCGYTKQYKELQAVHEKYRDRGLVVMGFPCNQFGGQEPGTEAEIASFCSQNYGVTFPMFGKVDVNGGQAAPLFKALTASDAAIKDTGPVKWNFEKFLIGRDGRPIARFRSSAKPDSPELTAAIEAALGGKP